MIERGVNYADIFAKKVRKSPKKYPETIKKMVDIFPKNSSINQNWELPGNLAILKFW